MMRRGILFLIVLLGLAGAVRHAHAFGRGDKGTSGAQFLKLPPGARAAAMGEAFTAIADDVYAVYYNPAGLAGIRKVEVGGAHNSHFQGISHNFGAVAVPLLSWSDTRRARNEWGVLALSVTNLSVGEIERRGLTETDAPIDTFGASDFAYTLGYGIEWAGASLGGAMKVIDQRIDDASARTVAFDGGARWERGRLDLALGFRNAGGAVKFRSEADDLPFLIYAGSAYELTRVVRLAADVRLPRDNSIGLSFAAEYHREVSRLLTGSLRFGYNTANADADGFGGMALGAGAEYKNTAFDFAWVPFGELGSTFRYSMRVRFD
jgi:hypothetical protein